VGVHHTGLGKVLKKEGNGFDLDAKWGKLLEVCEILGGGGRLREVCSPWRSRW